MVIHQQD
ncbi:Protein of unknown function [Cotesia congregata]|nr:Protein of unknown function [Cotesia congregata]